MLVIHGAAEAIAGLIILFSNLPAFRSIGRPARWFLGFGHSVWALGDLLWAFNYFIAGRGGEAAMGIGVSICCCLSFVSLAVALLLTVDGSIAKFFEPRLTIVSWGLATLIMTAMLFLPGGINSKLCVASVYAIVEVISLLTAYVLLALSLMILLASRDLGWSVHAAGIMGLVLGDSAIRIGKIFGGATNVDVFLVLCSVGFYSSLLPVMGSLEKRRVGPVNFYSLFTSCKFAIFGIIVACVAVFLSGQARDLFAVRLVSLCCGFGAFVSIFISAFFVAKIKTLATLIASVLQGELSPCAATKDLTSLPLELREHYELVFASAVRQQKVDALKKELQSKKKVLRKVAHNILSPVAVLRSLTNDLAGLPEESRVLLRTAIYDISDTAHSLSIDDAHDGGQEGIANQPVSVAGILEEIVSKKRVEYRACSSISLTTDAADAYGLFAEASEAELRSVVSNLINNAIDAMPDGGNVDVLVTGSAQSCEVEVKDNGCGMSAEVLSQVGAEGFTHGKAGGTGFGLFHAKKFVESWGGTIGIHSVRGQGTSVFLRLRRLAPAPWFVPSLKLEEDACVVVVDDNPAIHKLWNRRFTQIDSAEDLIHLSSLGELRSWLANSSGTSSRSQFLVDFDLQDDMDGLSVIEQLGIAKQSILVTSYSNSLDVRKRCTALGVRLLPKGSIGRIQISWPTAYTGERDDATIYDAVLVDDDAMNRKLWEQSAARQNVSILTFAAIEDFYAQAASIAKSSTIYIDADLGAGVRGDVEAQKIYGEYGYRKIILSTGYSAEQFSDAHWLAGVISKDPPWGMSRAKPVSPQELTSALT